MKIKKSIKIGEVFGRLIVLKEVEPHITPNGKKYRKVLVKCKCGNKKEVIYQHLKRGLTKSCGCLQKEIVKKQKSNLIHGMSKTDFYHIWQGINARCFNKNNTHYKYYGNRGIKCEWKSFIDFKDDMYALYLIHKKNNNYTSIERKNVNGNYCKNNCSFATRKEQANNTRSNILITYQNKTQSLIQWSKELNINYKILWQRINTYHWSIEKAFNN